MNILSYKGPKGADAVTETLRKLTNDLSGIEHRWWYMQDNAFHCCHHKQLDSHYICEFPESIVQGHSLYCNEFLWPLFHKQAKSIHFEQSSRQMFFQFNTFFSQSMIGFDDLSVVQPVFIAGYHLARSPQILYNCSGYRSTFVWNLPWPNEIDRFYVPFVSEIVQSLLHSQNLGFSTSQCAANFLSFVANTMPNHRVDILGRKIENLHEPDQYTRIQWHPFDNDFNN